MQDRRQRPRALVEAHACGRRPCSRRPPASRPAPAPRACGRAAARRARAPRLRPRRRASPPRHRRCRRAADAPQSAFEKRRAVLARIGPRRQIEQRMRGRARPRPRSSRRTRTPTLSAISRTARCTMAFCAIALARQRRIVARRPARAAAALERDQPRGARRLGFGRRSRFRRRSNIADFHSLLGARSVCCVSTHTDGIAQPRRARGRVPSR